MDKGENGRRTQKGSTTSPHHSLRAQTREGGSGASPAPIPSVAPFSKNMMFRAKNTHEVMMLR